LEARLLQTCLIQRSIPLKSRGGHTGPIKRVTGPPQLRQRRIIGLAHTLETFWILIRTMQLEEPGIGSLHVPLSGGAAIKLQYFPRI
jgi:hypothetical protein